MLHPRLAFAGAALALVVVGCGDDAATTSGTGPAFEGVSYVVPDANGNLVVSWKPAGDAVDYRVYVSKTQGRELKTAPSARSKETSVILTPEERGARYYVIVRAANVAGVEDANQVEKSAIASPDTTAPTFAGLRAAEPAGDAGVKLTWDAAKDDLTPPEAIVYDIYAGRSKTTLAKVATTLPGDTTISFTKLGNPNEQLFFTARARDIAGNASPEIAPLTAALGPDATTPVFDGCGTVTPQGSHAATVTWKTATDDATPASQLTYEVYVSKTPGGQDLNAAPAAKVTGDTTAALSNLDAASTYYVLCKVRDSAKNLDANKNEKPLLTGSDVTPPRFDGISGFTFSKENRTVTLEWKAGTDDVTAPSAIVYDVYESLASGGFDFDKPKTSSAPGASSIALTGLASRSTLYWVVRARDEAGNHDSNSVEKTGTTIVSFSVDVQTVFSHDCAVVGCHVAGTAPLGLNLTPGLAYANLVNVPGRMKPSMLRVPTNRETKDSFLWAKITAPDVGLLMPAPQTGNTLSSDDKSVIRDWIEGGALDN